MLGTLVAGTVWWSLAGASAGRQRDLLGHAHRAYPRFNRWAADGTWAALKAHVVALAQLDDDIDWHAHVDAPIVRIHQHAAGARKGAEPTD